VLIVHIVVLFLYVKPSSLPSIRPIDTHIRNIHSLPSYTTTNNMLSSYIYSTILAIATISSAAAVPSTHSLPQPLAPIKWRGQLEKGGPWVNFTGQHHEVIAQIKAQNPWWQREGANASIIMEHHVKEHGHLEKRSNRVNQICDSKFFEPANAKAEENNANYITSHFGNGLCAADGHSCGRFSCSYDSSILLCNDTPNEIVIPCLTLGTNAHFVYSYCQEQWAGTFNGQAFYINPSYNVIMKGML
jgi:hypothetical protein